MEDEFNFWLKETSLKFIGPCPKDDKYYLGDCAYASFFIHLYLTAIQFDNDEDSFNTLFNDTWKKHSTEFINRLSKMKENETSKLIASLLGLTA